ncbi:hypothetical protein E2320_017958 [Naja naja]|nr:hypothetical protein E2320_017958 [Naja naja]
MEAGRQAWSLPQGGRWGKAIHASTWRPELSQALCRCQPSWVSFKAEPEDRLGLKQALLPVMEAGLGRPCLAAQREQLNAPTPARIAESSVPAANDNSNDVVPPLQASRASPGHLPPCCPPRTGSPVFTGRGKESFIVVVVGVTARKSRVRRPGCPNRWKNPSLPYSGLGTRSRQLVALWEKQNSKQRMLLPLRATPPSSFPPPPPSLVLPALLALQDRRGGAALKPLGRPGSSHTGRQAGSALRLRRAGVGTAC